jgi:hypothetical protein
MGLMHTMRDSKIEGTGMGFCQRVEIELGETRDVEQHSEIRAESITAS